jgi:hypothetical protein
VNKHLLKDLVDRGLWNDHMKNLLIAENGSVQSIAGLSVCIGTSALLMVDSHPCGPEGALQDSVGDLTEGAD